MKFTKQIATLATAGFLLCAAGAYLSGCAKEIGTDGFVRVRPELRTKSGVVDIYRPALYQRRDYQGVGKPTYRLGADGKYESYGTLNETD